MKLGKIFICINILVYQNTSYRFDEYNRTIVLDGDEDCRMIRALPLEKNTPSQFKNRNSKTKMVFKILMAQENECVKIFTLFPEIHAPRTVALHHAKALQLNSYPYFSQLKRLSLLLCIAHVKRNWSICTTGSALTCAN